MTNASSPTYIHGSDKCEVCGNAVTFFDYLEAKKLGYQVCQSVYCKRIMSQKDGMSSTLFKSYLETNRNLLRTSRERNEARKKYIDKIIASELCENKQAFKSVVKKNPELSRSNTHWMVIPSGRSTLSPPADERVERYLAHIKKIVKEAAKFSNASEVTIDSRHDAYNNRLLVDQLLAENPDLHSLSDQLCSLCKGGCCSTGKDHAYLSVYSMRRYMDDNPELSAAEIIQQYDSKISTETIESSCINHTPSGCALPRELRSDICNGFYCNPVELLQKKMVNRANLSKVVVIQRAATYWNRLDTDVENEIVDVTLVGIEIK